MSIAPKGLGPILFQLQVRAQARDVAAVLDEVGINAILLRGPSLHARLHGAGEHHPAAAIEIAVARGNLGRAIESFAAAGFQASSTSAGSLRRRGFAVHLHDRVVDGGVVDELAWSTATAGEDGFLHPTPEILTLWLARAPFDDDFTVAQGEADAEAARRLVVDAEYLEHLRALAPAPPPLESRVGRAVTSADPASPPDASSVACVTFRGIDLRVPPDVFRPRAITGEAVDVVLEAIEDLDAPTVVDLGTGAGAVALAIACARPDARVYAVDLSPAAVEAARQNARRAQARVTILQGSIWSALPDRLRGSVRAATANLPYVPSLLHDINEGPLGTVYGPGIDGLGLVRQAAKAGRDFLAPGASLVIQVGGRFQWEIIEPDLRRLGYEGCALSGERTQGAVVARAIWPGPS